MGSKMLTGSMMLGGMILGFIMTFLETSTSETDSFAVVWPNSLLTARCRLRFQERYLLFQYWLL